MAAATRRIRINWRTSGVAATISYQILHEVAGTDTLEVPVSAGITEIGGTGIYTAVANIDDTWKNVSVVWSDGAVTEIGDLDDIPLDLAALPGKFAGITLIANWLRNMMRLSNPDPVATGEINANNGTGIGTFLPGTDSLEAIRDRGDAAWTTPGGGGGGGSGANDSTTVVEETLGVQ